MAQADSGITASPLLAQALRLNAPAFNSAFRQKARSSALDYWRYEIRRAYAAKHEYDRAGMVQSIAWDEGSKAQISLAEIEYAQAFTALIRSVDRMMAIPAPNKEALRWKERHAKLGGGRSHWPALIAADRANGARA